MNKASDGKKRERRKGVITIIHWYHTQGHRALITKSGMNCVGDEGFPHNPIDFKGNLTFATGVSEDVACFVIPTEPTVTAGSFRNIAKAFDGSRRVAATVSQLSFPETISLRNPPIHFVYSDMLNLSLEAIRVLSCILYFFYPRSRWFHRESQWWRSVTCTSQWGMKGKVKVNENAIVDRDKSKSTE